MRKLMLLITLAGAALAGFAQNMPDYPPFPVPEQYLLKGGGNLPYRVDNSSRPYFPEVFNQYGWSCNQASSIGYVFTYEMNRVRNLFADTEENLYTPGFVWNFLNSSDAGVGVSYFDSWEIVKAAGSPNFTDYTFYYTATGFWMSGYDKYYRAMQNRISVNYSIPIGTPEGLTIFKHYLHDHLEGSTTGGVASIQISSDRMDTRNWTDPDTGEPWPVIYTFGNHVGHALTLVGYNDSVKIDVNHDGQFTNDLDITGDGVVDMRDWEIGALLAVNSWGQYWNKGGKTYILYSVAAREGNDGGIWNRSAHVPVVMKTYRPELTMRVVMRHEQRKRLRVLAGFSTDTTAIRPQQTMSFPILNHQGDNTPLIDHFNNEDNRRFEFGLDITPLISQIDPNVPVKFFLAVEETDPAGVAPGRIDEFSVIHYGNAAVETVSPQRNVPVVNNGTTYLSLTVPLDFNKLTIEKPALTNVSAGQAFFAQLSASGGQPPYQWELVKDYHEESYSKAYTHLSGDTLSDFDEEIPFTRVNLPFSFPYWGTRYTSLVADIKGALYFENEYFEYPYSVNTDLIFTSKKSIVPFGANIQINVPGDALICKLTDSVAIFEWDASVYIGTTVYPVEVTAKLYPSGRIEFLYGKRTIPGTGDYPWKVGISNGDQSLYKYALISQSHVMFEDYTVTFTPDELPDELTLTGDGTLSGIASVNDYLWTIPVKVTDSHHQVKFSVVPISTLTQDTTTVESKNFPNPFRRTTGISFKVTDQQHVLLEVYDFSGRKVMELVNKTLTPGDFTYYWNARDINNRDVNPGTYIYRLTVGTKTESGKMVLVR